MFLLVHPDKVLIFIVIDDSTCVDLMPSRRPITPTSTCETLTRLRSSAAAVPRAWKQGGSQVDRLMFPVGAWVI